jgi:hypothetical protein
MTSEELSLAEVLKPLLSKGKSQAKVKLTVNFTSGVNGGILVKVEEDGSEAKHLAFPWRSVAQSLTQGM